MTKQPETITTNYLIIETAMVVYQVLEDSRLIVGNTLPEDHPYKEAELNITKWCNNFGSATIRDQSWQIAPLIEEVWRNMSEDERDGMITWDWEFIPDFLLYCVDWKPKREGLKLIADGADKLVEAFRKACEIANNAECGPASTRQRDQFIQECFEEAVKQWAYKDLVTDDCSPRNSYQGSRMQQAFEIGEKPAEFVKWLGEKYDLTPANEWFGRG